MNPVARRSGFVRHRPKPVTAPTGSVQKSFYAIGNSEVFGGQDGTGVAWPTLLANSIGQDGSVTILNGGRSGWTSTEIAIGTGAVDVTVNAFTIAADTSEVTLTVSAPTATFRATGTGGYWSWAGTIGGISGTLRRYTDIDAHWSFRRDTAGTATPVATGSIFHCTEQDARRGDCAIIAVGRNNADAQASVLSDVAKIISHLTTTNYLVVSVMTSNGETSGSTGYNQVTSLNTALANAYGARYVDARSYAVHNGMAYSGLTATSADTASIAADTMPPSLLWNVDLFHPNQYGYRAMAKAIRDALIANGFAASTANDIPSASNQYLSTGANLYPNGDFESAPSNFYSNSGAPPLVRTAGAGRSGYGMVATWTSSLSGGSFDFAGMNLVGGQSHAGSLWVKPSRSIDLGGESLYIDSNGNYLSGYYGPQQNLPGGVWSKIVLSCGYAPANATEVSIGVYTGDTWNSGDTLVIDDVKLVAGSAVP